MVIVPFRPPSPAALPADWLQPATTRARVTKRMSLAGIFGVFLVLVTSLKLKLFVLVRMRLNSCMSFRPAKRGEIPRTLLLPVPPQGFLDFARNDMCVNLVDYYRNCNYYTKRPQTVLRSFCVADLSFPRPTGLADGLGREGAPLAERYTPQVGSPVRSAITSKV